MKNCKLDLLDESKQLLILRHFSKIEEVQYNLSSGLKVSMESGFYKLQRILQCAAMCPDFIKKTGLNRKITG